MNSLLCFIHDESGVTSIEFGLIGSMIAVAVIASITTSHPPMNANLTPANYSWK